MAKYFKNLNELSVRNLTEVIYTSGKILSHKLPLFGILITDSPVWYILNTLLYEGIISPEQYYMLTKMENNLTSDSTIDVLVGMIMSKKTNRLLIENLDGNLIAAYLASVVIMSSEALKLKYFTGDMYKVGAINNSFTTYAVAGRVKYDTLFHHITGDEWDSLTKLTIQD